MCGVTPVTNRIVGGADAPAGSWPWQVSLQRFGRHICGGSLINREWVMSAAHCFSRWVTVTVQPSNCIVCHSLVNTLCFCDFSISTFGWQISLGRQNLQGTNPNEVSRRVSRIILHPFYDSDSSNNDISLLKLSSAVTFTDYVRPVCLAASDSVFNNGTDSWVTGWGDVNEGGESACCCQFFALISVSLPSGDNGKLCGPSDMLLLPQFCYRSLKLCKKWKFRL